MFAISNRNLYFFTKAIKPFGSNQRRILPSNLAENHILINSPLLQVKGLWITDTIDVQLTKWFTRLRRIPEDHLIPQIKHSALDGTAFANNDLPNHKS